MVEGGSTPEWNVSVRTLSIGDRDDENISRARKSIADLQERQEEIAVAIQQASDVLSNATQSLAERPEWHVSSLEAKFSLTLGVEAGVLISKATAEASLEVTITLSRV